jgi:hypothetical protein
LRGGRVSSDPRACRPLRDCDRPAGTRRYHLPAREDRGVLRYRSVRLRGGDPVVAPRRRSWEGLGKDSQVAPCRGTLTVVEFAWDRFDEATAEWALEHLPAASSSEKPSWLQRCCWQWARGDQGGTRAAEDAHFPRWAHEEGVPQLPSDARRTRVLLRRTPLRLGAVSVPVPR